MDFDHKKIADVVDALTGFKPDYPVGWEDATQEIALKKYLKLLFELVDRYGSYIGQKTDRAGRKNLYDYDGEASRSLAKLGKQIVDDFGDN